MKKYIAMTEAFLSLKIKQILLFGAGICLLRMVTGIVLFSVNRNSWEQYRSDTGISILVLGILGTVVTWVICGKNVRKSDYLLKRLGVPGPMICGALIGSNVICFCVLGLMYSLTTFLTELFNVYRFVGSKSIIELFVFYNSSAPFRWLVPFETPGLWVWKFILAVCAGCMTGYVSWENQYRRDLVLPVLGLLGMFGFLISDGYWFAAEMVFIIGLSARALYKIRY